MIINGNKIWATGGIDKTPGPPSRHLNETRAKGDLSAKYTEYIGSKGTSIGPELPNSLIFTSNLDPSIKEPVRRHSVTNINETTSILIGGYSALAYQERYYQERYSSETYFFNHSTQKWTKGPNLNVGRLGHVSGMVTDTVTNEKYLMVIGGSGEYSRVDSTEILMDGRWIIGKISYVMISF